MSEIKFHKANALPSPISQAHDGVWLIADGANNYKHYIITGGVVKELIVDGEDLTLEQARQNGNILEGDVVINNSSSGQFQTGFISEGGSSKIAFTDEGGAMINNLTDNVNSYIDVYTNSASLGINDSVRDNQISIEATYISNEPSILISTSGKEETKGLIGSKEFNKQGDRKAFAQIGDIEDAMIDYSSLTNQRHIKKVGSSLVDSNIQDTTIGSEVLGRLDSYATVERRTIVTNASSLYTIDLSNPSGHYDIRLTGNTTIGFSNMITAIQSIVITLTVRGNYSLLFPSWLKPMPYNDDYHSSSVVSDLNLITIIIRHGGSSPSGIYSLTNVDIS